jgi:UDP-N-acetylmuramate--alanine ligase
VQVSGSDTTPDSVALAELAALGARVYTGHAAGHLGDADTLVVSSAIRANNPELVEANRRGLRVVHRAAALASLMFGRRVVAVTGTHGKTSTTSMIATVLIETSEPGAGPAYAIGGVLAATGVGAADGDGPYFVAEADESDGSFLMYAPDVAVVTNVDADHLDNYGTEAAYRASFAAFIGRVKPGGLLVTCADDSGTRDLAAAARTLGLRVVSYGESADADYRIAGVTTSGMQTSFSIRAEPSAEPSAEGPTGPAGTAGTEPLADQSRPGPFGKIDLDLQLRVPGRHNALNAAAAFAAAMELAIVPGRVATALASYRGAARRLEPKGEARGVRVLDTYAHHPTELAADLRAARDITTGGGRVIAVFQPHLFSRTRIFAAEFGAALGLADEAVVLDVYAAREDPEPGVTGRLVADAVPGGAARYVPDFADVPAVVASLARPGDLVLTMGAGDITKMGPLVLDEIAASGAAAP